MFHKILVASAILFVSFFASAQSKSPPSETRSPTLTERRLFSDEQSVTTIVKAIGRCDALRAQAMISKPEIGKDHKGRVSTIRINNTDFVLEYLTDNETRPSAVIGMGARLKSTLGRSDIPDFDRKALRARVELYRHVRKVCGLPPVASYFSDDLIPAYFESEEDDPPYEWFDTGFWSEVWQPMYQDTFLAYYWQPKPEPQRCFDDCSQKCELAGDANDAGCLVAGAVATDYFGLAGGTAVALACFAGKTIGKYYCRNECQKHCK